MNLTPERVDDGYLKVLIVAQTVVAEVLSELFAVLDGLQVAFEVGPDLVSHRDAILHVEKELLHRATPQIASAVAAQAPWHQDQQVAVWFPRTV
jgi:hypothetical protein